MSEFHHAYLLVGEREEADSYLNNLLTELGIEKQGNPDFFLYSDQLGIKEARAISERALEKSFGEKKAFVILGGVTSEAQNALLKTIEEPIPNTHFFIYTREAERIIPTLRSRMETRGVGGEVESASALKFLKSSIKDRINFAKKFADKEGDTGTFLDELIQELKAGKKMEDLSRVYKLRAYALDKSISRRLVLEHLALVLTA